MSAQEVPIAGAEPGDLTSVQPGFAPSAVKKEQSSSNGQVLESSSPAEICVIIGESRNAQTQGSYMCGDLW
ncbi:hypothetical protein SKAU_G00016240 [Synaphobranchus kaupii]|uniref:Uncharacterized protein n=1 Tax=Synaphobranchus kaupii TaxID=118154 RepID=A0A9Q1JBR3_SYNKA|nr:hypothetical protein SKAU_G00016240 [Synaphobranchus kaupii]